MRSPDTSPPTSSDLYARAEKKLSTMEKNVQAWFDDHETSWSYFSVDHLLSSDDMGEHAQQLRRRARLLELRLVAWGMTNDHVLTASARRSLAQRLAQDDFGMELVQDATQAYAFLSCVFTAEALGMSDTNARRLTTFFHRWLPESKDIRFTNMSSANVLADLLFDPLWRTLYDIDFDNLGVAARDKILCTRPPLRGDPFGLMANTRTCIAALPPDLAA